MISHVNSSRSSAIISYISSINSSTRFHNSQQLSITTPKVFGTNNHFWSWRRNIFRNLMDSLFIPSRPMGNIYTSIYQQSMVACSKLGQVMAILKLERYITKKNWTFLSVRKSMKLTGYIWKGNCIWKVHPKILGYSRLLMLIISKRKEIYSYFVLLYSDINLWSIWIKILPFWLMEIVSIISDQELKSRK